MNDTLLKAVRRTMSAYADGELLRIWVENDRFKYSREAFEAVRSLLAERGVDPLPAQDEPPAMATRVPRRWALPGPPALEPGQAFWYGGLRAVLWVGAVLALIRIAAMLAAAWYYGSLPEYGFPSSGATVLDWLASANFRAVVLNLVSSVWFLVGFWVALRLRRRARIILITWAVACLVAPALETGIQAYEGFRSERSGALAWYLIAMAEAAHLVAYPVLLVLLLRAAPIHQLFHRSTGGRFEVTPLSQVPLAADARAGPDA